MKRVFIDMDGTLSRFYEDEAWPEKFRNPGYFLNLRPYDEMVEAARMLIQRNDIRVYILSAVEGEMAVREKEAWLLQHFGFDPLGCFFPRVGESKAEYIKSFYGEITKDDFLIDDYSANLVDWENAGGTGLKLINEINGRGTNGTNFEGIRIDAHQTAEKIYADICAALNIQI